MSEQRLCRIGAHGGVRLGNCPTAFVKLRSTIYHPCSLGEDHKGDHVCRCGKRSPRVLNGGNA